MINIEEFAIEQHIRYLKVHLSNQITCKKGICDWSYLKKASRLSNNVDITKNISNLAERFVILHYSLKQEISTINLPSKRFQYLNELFKTIQEIISLLNIVEPSDIEDIFNLKNDILIATQILHELKHTYWKDYIHAYLE